MDALILTVMHYGKYRTTNLAINFKLFTNSSVFFSPPECTKLYDI